MAKPRSSLKSFVDSIIAEEMEKDRPETLARWNPDLKMARASVAYRMKRTRGRQLPEPLLTQPISPSRLETMLMSPLSSVSYADVSRTSLGARYCIRPQLDRSPAYELANTDSDDEELKIEYGPEQYSYGDENIFQRNIPRGAEIKAIRDHELTKGMEELRLLDLVAFVQGTLNAHKRIESEMRTLLVQGGGTWTEFSSVIDDFDNRLRMLLGLRTARLPSDDRTIDQIRAMAEKVTDEILRAARHQYNKSLASKFSSTLLPRKKQAVNNWITAVCEAMDVARAKMYREQPPINVQPADGSENI